MRDQNEESIKFFYLFIILKIKEKVYFPKSRIYDLNILVLNTHKIKFNMKLLSKDYHDCKGRKENYLKNQWSFSKFYKFIKMNFLL